MTQKNKIVGTLVPISALRSKNQSPKNFGTFQTGLAFLDWLKKTDQNAWQLLPLHQTQLEADSRTKHVPSPYKGYGIGLDPRYLTKGLKETEEREELKSFVDRNKYWIEDYALFCALRDHFGTDDWREWDSGLSSRKKAVIDNYSKLLRREIDHHILIQCLLHKEYEELKHKAEKLGIILIGDLPFYISIKSPLVWAHQYAFQLEKDGRTKYVSGLPDTPLAHFGRQIWGHPLYRWGEQAQNKKVTDFWKIRLKYLASIFDSMRFDHAKGLFDYGVIHPRNKKIDKFVKGPGGPVLKVLIDYCKSLNLSIFAEDSGENLSELRITLKKLEISGIKIFRFALNEKKKKLNQEYASVSNYHKKTVAYTTTHDTETLISYLEILNYEQKRKIAAYANVKYSEDILVFAQRIRKAIISSPAQMVIIPIQDWLLTTDRINIPGTEKEKNDPNWRYMLTIPVEDLPIIF